ncbi:MAG: hypothetical protein HY020_21010 [Burkholderiales bacterium]|nr:hypothetical protein [Burkholderiales bacterium]
MHKPLHTSPARWIAGLTVALLAAACSSVKAPPQAESAEPDFVVRNGLHSTEPVTAQSLAAMTPMNSPDGQRFYLFMALCCDQFNRLYDADGRFVCAPSGGFTGQGDGRCPAWVFRRVWGQPSAAPSSNPGRVAESQ